MLSDYEQSIGGRFFSLVYQGKTLIRTVNNTNLCNPRYDCIEIDIQFYSISLHQYSNLLSYLTLLWITLLPQILNKIKVPSSLQSIDKHAFLPLGLAMLNIVVLTSIQKKKLQQGFRTMYQFEGPLIKNKFVHVWLFIYVLFHYFITNPLFKEMNRMTFKIL